MSDDRFVFLTEWFDTAASLIRSYQMSYYPKENALEIWDIKNKRKFLKKTPYPQIQPKDLYIGSIVNVYSRQLKIVDYADVYTRNKFEVQREKTFGMIKPDCYKHIGKIINAIEQSGFVISNIKMAKMKLSDSQEFYAEHKGKPFYEDLTTFMASDYVVGMELVADGAIRRWRKLIGPTNCQIARVEAPNSLRALYGTEGVRNACHGADSPASARRELNFFFGPQTKLRTTASFKNCSCAVIKPHVFQDGNVGKIIDIILEKGFEVSAIDLFNLDKPIAEEFFDVYKGVLPEYSAMVEHMTSGPVMALEVRQENVVQGFRELCGPHDPEIAKTLRKGTIRAAFGRDRVRNAVHCTDLPEDGSMEVEYFFNILQSI